MSEEALQKIYWQGNEKVNSDISSMVSMKTEQILFQLPGK